MSQRPRAFEAYLKSLPKRPEGASCAHAGAKSRVVVCSGGSRPKTYRSSISGSVRCCPEGEIASTEHWLKRIKRKRAAEVAKKKVQASKPTIAPASMPRAHASPAAFVPAPSVIRPPAPRPYAPAPAPRPAPAPHQPQADILTLFIRWLRMLFGGAR